MRKINIKYLVISLIVFFLVSLIAFYVYKETYGYPWKHTEVKKEAVQYMKHKYNMDVKVVRSTFNYKFNYYMVNVLNVNDESENLINVEKHKYYDENGQFKGERLEDNYSKVYWESRLQNELQTRYPKFFMLPDIKEINTDIAYFTLPLEDGVSTLMDDYGIYIPLKPDNHCILDIDVNSPDLSDDFLKEILIVIKDLANTQVKVDLIISGKYPEKNSEKITKIFNLEYEKFKEIDSIEDLKKEVADQ